MRVHAQDQESSAVAAARISRSLISRLGKKPRPQSCQAKTGRQRPGRETEDAAWISYPARTRLEERLSDGSPTLQKCCDRMADLATLRFLRTKANDCVNPSTTILRPVRERSSASPPLGIHGQRRRGRKRREGCEGTAASRRNVPG